ncbi:MAG: hypothetical protein FIB01_05525 [Gemmatimonadetes bacterium]|nr:hypothetical protein [Gemmatimonadota bacterium]
MNYRRVLLGGLIAGLVIEASETLLNGVVLAKPATALLEAHGLTYAPWAMPVFGLMAFLYGFLLAWLYAALRPRFGPGFGTAVIAAAVLWITAYIFPSVGMLGLGVSTWQLSAIALLWGAAELVVAAAAAGWLYREPQAGAAPRVQ